MQCEVNAYLLMLSSFIHCFHGNWITLDLFRKQSIVIAIDNNIVQKMNADAKIDHMEVTGLSSRTKNKSRSYIIKSWVLLQAASFLDIYGNTRVGSTVLRLG